MPVKDIIESAGLDIKYIYSPEKDHLITGNGSISEGTSHAQLFKHAKRRGRKSYRLIGFIRSGKEFSAAQYIEDDPPEEEFQMLIFKLYEHPELFKDVENARYTKAPFYLVLEDQSIEFPEYFDKTIRELVDIFSKD